MELLVENVMARWHLKHKTGYYESYEAKLERDRQRCLNPAYVPSYSETDLFKAAEVWPEQNYWHDFGSFQKRPLRDLTAFKFLTHLEDIQLTNCQATDLSVFAELPKLRALHFASSKCADYRPLARCQQLRSLTLHLMKHWPELTGLDQLSQLESFHLTGNLIALPPGLIWPNVRQGTLSCAPLAVRSVRELPRFPACEFLTLAGVDRLDGIEHFPKLRNLTVTGVVSDFAPLTVLHQLTCFTHNGAEPLDISPLTVLPRLYFLSFKSHHVYNLDKVRPRDFMPLLDAPQLRELNVEGCPPVDAEVANLNNLFATWDELLLAPEPLPLPPLRFIIAPMNKHPRAPVVALEPEDNGLADEGLRLCEALWVEAYIARHVTAKLGGQSEWGTISAQGLNRTFFATFTCFTLIEKLPVMIDALREVIAALRPAYIGGFMVCLKAPKLEATPAQVELEKQFQDLRDKEDHDEYKREHKEHLDRLYRYDLKKQAGEKINPSDFAVPPPLPTTPPPWASEDDDDDDSNSEAGGVVVKDKPDPPPSWCDDSHPLEREYRMIGAINLSEVWIINYARDIASYLLGREPDLEIPEDPK